MATPLILAAKQHLGNCQTQDGQADTGQALHGPVAQMCTDLIIHLGRMIVVCVQQMLAETIHRVLFIVFFMAGNGLCQRGYHQRSAKMPAKMHSRVLLYGAEYFP